MMIRCVMGAENLPGFVEGMRNLAAGMTVWETREHSPETQQFVSYRGVPYEILPANSNPVRMNERHWEALDLIVKAWTHHDGPFSFEGRFFHHRSINIWPRCYQQPHPPIWVSTTSPGGAAQVGSHGYVQATFLTGFDTTKRIYEAYRRGWREARSDRGGSW